MRKGLGRHEIATVQTTTIDQDTGQIRLTTLLAHASGEWISSDWPVCPSSETATPHRMGAALTYARRYVLFTLVGIAGEDDLDAPEAVVEPSPAIQLPLAASKSTHMDRKAPNGSTHKTRETKPILSPQASQTLRDQLLCEIADVEDLALWAHRRLPAKNTLTSDRARDVENAYQTALGVLSPETEEEIQQHRDQADGPAPVPTTIPDGTSPANIPTTVEQPEIETFVTPLSKPIRRRNKAHLALVASRSCLICQRSPCDAHHLKFSQPRTLGRKVSDEFTVPLCREHHHELHRHGNEMAWWANVKIAPLEAARMLWDASMHPPESPSSGICSTANQSQKVEAIAVLSDDR